MSRDLWSLREVRPRHVIISYTCTVCALETAVIVFCSRVNFNCCSIHAHILRAGDFSIQSARLWLVDTRAALVRASSVGGAWAAVFSNKLRKRRGVPQRLSCTKPLQHNKSHEDLDIRARFQVSEGVICRFIAVEWSCESCVTGFSIWRNVTLHEAPMRPAAPFIKIIIFF